MESSRSPGPPAQPSSASGVRITDGLAQLTCLLFLELADERAQLIGKVTGDARSLRQRFGTLRHVNRGTIE